MNLVVFSGFIGNIEYRKVNEEFSVCDFSLAYSYKPKEGDEVTHWFNFKAYNRNAEFIEKWFKKGEGINIQGHLSTESWEKDGQTRYKTFVVVDKAEFPPAKRDRGPVNSSTDNNIKGPTPAETMAPPPENGGLPEEVKDDLPF
jgi:single-strand DNA-binding protein